MINALFAVDYYGGMGLNGTLPWPQDTYNLESLDKLIVGHVVVMGRRTWDDYQRSARSTETIIYVATNRPNNRVLTIQGDIVAEILRLEKQYPDRVIWLVGGAQLIES